MEHNIIAVVVLLIGVYMVYAFRGEKLLIPPVLSGVAFILIGLSQLL